jgi:alkyl sulfatase BDS1-like metallo-beta-lactamase superfamily hydrolase
VNVDPERCADVQMTLAFRMMDRNETYALELRRGVLQIHERTVSAIDVQLALETSTLYGMLRDMATQLPKGLESGTVILERGTAEQLRRFFDCFDQPARRMPALTTR